MLPVPTLKAAFKLADTFGNALLAASCVGSSVRIRCRQQPDGSTRAHRYRAPIILLSSTGTRLCHEAAKCEAAFLACLRNYVSVADYLAENLPTLP